MRYTSTQKAQYRMAWDGVPVTKALIGLAVTMLFVIGFSSSSSGERIASFLQFDSRTLVRMPWTLLIYPLAPHGGPFPVAFGCIWLWMAGGSLERSWGSARYLQFFLIMTAISALGLLAGALLQNVALFPVGGLWIPLAAVTVAFAMLNPEESILIWFVMPIKLKLLAILSVILLFVHYVQVGILVGVFSLTGCALAYWYVNSGRSRRFAPINTSVRGEVVRLYKPQPLLAKLNPIRWFREYRERKRLRRFLDR